MKILYFLLLLVISGCGYRIQDEIAGEIQLFACQPSDFERYLNLTGTMTAQNFHSTDQKIFELIERADKALATHCSKEVLSQCKAVSPKPTGAFGIRANASLIFRYQHDGYAKTRTAEMRYLTTMDVATLKQSLKCFLEATRAESQRSQTEPTSQR